MVAKPPPLTRAELIEILRDRLSVSLKDANRLIESTLDIIADVMQDKGSVSLAGLGRFQVKLTPARPGRNPKTGAYAEVPGRYRPTFTMSRSLRERLLDYGKRNYALDRPSKPNVTMRKKKPKPDEADPHGKA
ncbi:MAG: HU family DNA-binding protein [Deltaproteobacteria bacterium]|jgi:nucleoid DNA-binding protein|nr:HU family DNA-binding protein [Deltaproteobacteria bacterium]